MSASKPKRRRAKEEKTYLFYDGGGNQQVMQRWEAIQGGIGYGWDKIVAYTNISYDSLK